MLTITNFNNHDGGCRAMILKPSDEFLTSFIATSSITNVLFMIDNSGSMGDRLRDSSFTKHMLVKQSLLTVLDYFLALAVQGHSIVCSISTFNSHLNHLSTDVHINDENITILKHNVNMINVLGGTDISKSLEYCNQWLNDKQSNDIVIFITDGYHSQRDEIPELIDNFTKYDTSRYYSVGLGISGDYDHELMGKLFTNFVGCPNKESVSDNIIRSAFSGTSTILKNVQISFSDNVTEIKTSLEKVDTHYVVDKLDLSTKIPFYFQIVESGFVTITGINTNGENTIYTFNLNDKLVENPIINLFEKYFDLEKEYLQIIEHSESQVSCKLQLKALKVIITDIIKNNGERLGDLLPFYTNLQTKINNFISNVDGIHVTQLDNDEFKHWLNLGSVAIRHASANVVVPQLSRQTSINMTQTINRGHSHYAQDIPMPHPVPLRRGINIRHVSAPIRAPNPMQHMLSTISEESMCKICFANPIQVMALPCKHVTSCIGCTRHMNQCPICRQTIEAGKELKVGSKCFKCKLHVPNILFLPCSHVVVCEDCVTKKVSSICNKCGERFGSYCKLYV